MTDALPLPTWVDPFLKLAALIGIPIAAWFIRKLDTRLCALETNNEAKGTRITILETNQIFVGQQLVDLKESSKRIENTINEFRKEERQRREH